MNVRIKNFLDTQGLSASEFADTIGVQRSNVTHVLKGRNKPSFQFIEKMIQKYPALSAKWLITGEGEMMESKTSKAQSSLFDSPEKQTKQQNEPTPELPNQPEQLMTQSKPETKLNDLPVEAITAIDTSKKIEKIIIFYNDQSFKAYHPSKD